MPLSLLSVTPGFKVQSRMHLIHASKKTTYIITDCIEINTIITLEYLLHSGSLTKIKYKLGECPCVATETYITIIEP
jgi:hypothetical protein